LVESCFVDGLLGHADSHSFWGGGCQLLLQPKPFAATGTSLRDAFINAIATLLHLLALFVFPFWCGGLCAAHPPPPEGSAVRAG